VFARLADLDGYWTWMRGTGLFRRSRQTSDGSVGLGTAYFDATRMGTFRGEVTRYEPPARLPAQRESRLPLRWTCGICGLPAVRVGVDCASDVLVTMGDQVTVVSCRVSAPSMVW
jgi:hypothetical protein